MKTEILINTLFVAALLFASLLSSNGQENQPFALSADDLQNDKQIALDKLNRNASGRFFPFQDSNY